MSKGAEIVVTYVTLSALAVLWEIFRWIFGYGTFQDVVTSVELVFQIAAALCLLFGLVVCLYWGLVTLFRAVRGLFSESVAQPETDESPGCFGISLLVAGLLLGIVALGLDFFIGDKDFYHTLFGSPN